MGELIDGLLMCTLERHCCKFS